MPRLAGAALLLLAVFSARADDAPATAWRVGGHAALALRAYPQSPEGSRENGNAGLRLAPEWTLRQGALRFTVAPDLRLENAGSGRSRADFNELNASARLGDATVDFGVTRLFWGVAESRHLENILNPPDLAAHYAGDTTLGIALLRLARPTAFGQFELILAPWERDPRYPGTRGRPRTGLPVEGSVSHPEGSPAAWAMRLSLGGGDFDAHVYHFSGLDREAVLTPQFDANAQAISLRASRRPIRQWGADLQAPIGNFLLKGEAIRRTGYSRGFNAAVLGSEYTLNSIADSAADLAFMLECQYDGRPDDAPLAPMKRGLYGGIRVALNDPASTEFKFGLLRGGQGRAQVWRGDFSRRIAENWTLEGAVNVFRQVRTEPALSGFARDSHIEVQFRRHFH